MTDHVHGPCHGIPWLKVHCVRGRTAPWVGCRGTIRGSANANGQGCLKIGPGLVAAFSYTANPMHSSTQYQAIKQIRDQLLLSKNEYERVAGGLEQEHVKELIQRICNERPRMAHELDRDLLQHDPGPGRARRVGGPTPLNRPQTTGIACPLRLCQWREQHLIEKYLAVLGSMDLLESTRALLARQCSELERGLKRFTRLLGTDTPSLQF